MKPVSEVLSRELEDGLSSKLTTFAEMIESTVNMGTHIIEWDTAESRSGDYNLPPLMFLRSIVELADSTSILIRNSCAEACKPLVRTIIESFFGLEYLLENNTKQRSKAYLVWNNHRKIRDLQKLLTSESLGKDHQAELAKDKLMKGLPEIFDKDTYTRELKGLKELLNNKQYKSTQDEYIRTKRVWKKNRYGSPRWYSLYNGPRNIKALASHLKLNGIYEIHYRMFSDVIHASRVLDGKLIENKDGSASILQIRLPTEAQELTQTIILFTCFSMDSFIKSRLPARLTDYDNWKREMMPYIKSLGEKPLIRVDLSPK